MKRIAKIIGIICVLLLAISLLALGAFAVVLKVKNNHFIEPTDKQFVDYLNQNKIVLNPKTYESGKALFDDEAYKSSIILLGESHGVANVQSIDKEIFLHLNKKLGVRHYLAEMDSIRANQLNSFLCGIEKDTALLKKIVMDIRQRIPQQSSVELYEKWSDIYDYNTTLPDTLKLCVIGVDTDFDSDSPISRDSAMIHNFKSIVKKRKIENEKFYGLFGLFHISQNGVNSDNFQPFVARLKTNGFKTTSIACLYVDSKVYLPQNDQFPTPPSEQIGFLNMDGPLILVKGINDLKKATNKNEATLFNLSAANSPYFKSKKIITMKTNFFNQIIMPFNEQLSTTDFVQYVIIIRNSKALTPIK